MPLNRDDVLLGNVARDEVDPWWPDPSLRRLAKAPEQRKEGLLPQEQEHQDKKSSQEQSSST